MPITVGLHTDPNLTNNIKYRTGGVAAAFFTTTAVNIGNFASTNMFADNAVEIGGITYLAALQANYITVTMTPFVVVGQILDMEYVNDGNTRITYAVDPFSSAMSSGRVAELNGLCERVNMDTAQALDNLQPEPFSPSDVTTENTAATTSFNSLVQGFEGVLPSPSGISSGTTALILTVSPAIVEYLGVSAFDTPPTGFTQELQILNGDLKLYANDTTVHGGGVFRGTPLKFTNMSDVQAFIRQILGGCGFVTRLPGSGYSNQQLDTNLTYVADTVSSTGQVELGNGRNQNGYAMESVRFITTSDIYNLYCIPENFATNRTENWVAAGNLEGFKTLADLHRFGAEDSPKGKLLAHPYYYCRLVTANGDSVNIIPQSHWDSFTAGGTYCAVDLRFIGGDNPRLMGNIRLHDGSGPYLNSTISEWFTIRNYPAVTLSVNDSYNPQVQKDIANIRKVSATITNSRYAAQLKTPLRQGHRDGVNGATGVSENLGTNNYQSYAVGRGLGTLYGKFSGGTQSLSNDDMEAIAADVRTSEAGNFISAETLTLMGNDFMSQFSISAASIYNCGATDAELYGFARYLEMFGAACNCHLNPLTNAGSILGGAGTVNAFNGRTFYKYHEIVVTGSMPIPWKQGIKDLFESGVYLI